jgi:hypothetical protein
MAPLLPRPLGLPPAFIPPAVAPVAANAIVPFVAPAAGGAAAAAAAAGAPLVAAGVAAYGLGFLIGTGLKKLAQEWGLFNPNRPTAGLPNHFYPPGVLEVVSGDYLAFQHADGSPSWTATAYKKFISLVNTGVPGGFGTTVWRLTVQLASGSIHTKDLPRTYAEVLPYTSRMFGAGIALVVSTGAPVSPLDPYIPEPEPLAEPGTVRPRPVPIAPAYPAPLVPGAVPPEPAPLPGTEQAPDPVRPRAPVRVPVLPQPTPSALPTVDGVVVSPSQTPTPTTNPDAVFPIPGRPPVVGNGPRPELGEIAKELGRLESKLHGLMNPAPEANPVPEWINDLGDTLNFARMVYELFTATQAGGTYTLSSPCVLDESGGRIPTEIDYEGDLGWLGVLSNKIDALAQLQQAAKNLKQPICRHKAEGQPVTVTFTQQ